MQKLETQNYKKINSNCCAFCFVLLRNKSVYDRYSFGIGIGQYIGFADKGNVLLVSVLADTDFHIGC